jgi:hypothetical protein
MTTDKAINAELRQFLAAVQQRLGDDTIRATRSSGGGLVEAAAVLREHHAALAAVSRTVQALQEGRFASANQTEAARLVQRQAVAGGRWPRASHRPEVMAIRGGLVSIVLPTRWLVL